ncbi:MAG: hypothetical protein AABY32_01690 [Nanoarchaeota archaeon]
MFPTNSNNFHLINDGDYDKVWVSDMVNYGDFDLFFFIVLQYTDEWGGDIEHPYHISIQVVSPEAAGKKHVKSAFRSMSIEGKEYNKMIKTLKPEDIADIVRQYGVAATIFQKFGDDEDKLINAAVKEMTGINCLFGFYMDKYQNRIGATGWDFIRGDIMPDRVLNPSN